MNEPTVSERLQTIIDDYELRELVERLDRFLPPPWQIWNGYSHLTYSRHFFHAMASELLTRREADRLAEIAKCVPSEEELRTIAAPAGGGE